MGSKCSGLPTQGIFIEGVGIMDVRFRDLRQAPTNGFIHVLYGQRDCWSCMALRVEMRVQGRKLCFKGMLSQKSSRKP